MRRPTLPAAAPAAALALGTVLALVSPAHSTPHSSAHSSAPASHTASASARAGAQRALRTATHLLSGQTTRTDASMALLRLRLTMHSLGPADRRRAAAILARPTDQPDPYGESYSVKAERRCSGHICIHWVPTTRDAPPSTAWVTKQLRMMNAVWTYEVGKLGYRRPPSDGTRGGGGADRFDVYLKELFHQGRYGETVAERPTPDNKQLYSSYLLLDNDFKRSQYGADPMQVARVTAAHEFFHAVQYGYDAGEDPWLMESTATWMEDQFDDSSNDNRQYLPWSQLHRPGTPLDTFSGTSFEQYGNWVFFEYLSEHYGRSVVKTIWQHAAAYGRHGHEFSAAAIRSALRKVHGGMTTTFGKYANGNTVPGRTYSEGAHYPAAPLTGKVTLTQSAPATAWNRYGVHHLASVNLRAIPGSDLNARKWSLQVKVDGPKRKKAPAVVVLVKRKHRPMTRIVMHLSKAGRGHVKVPFSRVTTSSVTVTLANASTAFRCHTGGGYSCNGTSKAAFPMFNVRLIALKH
jgi:hypothetical protein